MAVDYLSAINQGGSGLNITQIVDSLVDAEKTPQENAIQTKIDDKTTSISAIGEVIVGETSNLATWTAPMEPGLYSISCSVSDESYGLDIATIEITVE